MRFESKLESMGFLGKAESYDKMKDSGVPSVLVRCAVSLIGMGSKT